MEDFEKAYAELKLENEQLRGRLTLLESGASKNSFESRYKGLFEGSTDAVAISQGEWIVDANKAFLKLFGYDELDECVARPIIQHVADQSRALIREKLDKAAQGRTRPTCYDMRIVRKDGTIRDVEVMATEFACDGQKFIQSSFRDITERKQAERQLVDHRDTLEAEVRRRTAQLERNIQERKLTEQKMEKERNLLRTLVDNIPDVIYVKDTEGRFTICNKACIETLGLRGPDAILGKTDRDFFEPEVAAGFSAEEQEIMRTGIPMLKKEESTVDTDGNRGWILHTKVPFIDDCAQTIGIIGIGQNITPQKQAQIALAEERNLLRTLINNIPDEIYVKDTKGRLLMCNKATVAGLGAATDKDVLGRTDTDFFTLEQAHAYRRDEQEVLRTGLAMVDKEESATARDGSRVWFRTTKAPLLDNEGQTIGLVGIGRDVTKEKEAEAALTAERNILRIMIDNLPDHIYVKDRQHRFTTCNKAVEERHGHFPIGKTDFDLYPHERAEAFHAEEEHVMSTGEPLYNKDQYAFYENGDLKQCSLVNKFPLRDNEGTITGIVGINHDITEIKRAQQALQEERNVLRTLIDNLPDHIYVKDTDSRFTICNLAVEQAHKCVPIGKTDFDLYPHSRAEEYYTQEQQVIKTGVALVNDEHYEYDDSGAMTCCWTVSKFPLRDANGSMLGIVGINHDITEAKCAQRALVEERNLLRTVIDNLPAHIYVKDLESKFTMCNSSVANMYACDPVGKTDFDLYPRQEAQQYYEQEQKLMHTAETLVGYEWRAFDESGAIESCWSVNKFPLRDASGHISGLVGIDFDITESKLAEQALRESEEQYRTLVENSLDGIAISQGDTMVFVNRQVVEMFGYDTADEMCKLTPWRFFVPEQQQMIKERGLARMEGREVPNRYECTGVRKDGTRLDVEIAASLISHKGTRAIQVLMRDITERNRLKRELAEYREKIVQAEKNAYVNSIGAAVAHQLNQPLTVINLLLEETLSKLAEIPCLEAVKAHVADCLAETKNAAEIIARFRTYSKDPHFEVSTPVNVLQVLARIAAALSDNAARMKVRVTVKQTCDVPSVEASTAALEQVGFLLIQNAIQAADGKSDHKLEISIRPARNAVRIEFADDCGGVPKENLQKIFEPFFSTKPAGQGTGLGLTIVRRILLAHGGKVSVRSRAGRGSTFSVLWPLRRDAQ